MRTISRLLRTSWLVLLGVVFALPLPPIVERDAWQGATPGWSPKADVATVERTSEWDVRGWMDDSQRELHAALDEIEKALRANLIAIREEVYEWRDVATA